MQTSKNHAAGLVNELAALKLDCFSFLPHEMIPRRYTTDGININPCIYIEYIPEEAKSMAVIVEDPDVPHDSFCHWVAWNIPVTHQIKEKENRGIFGINDFGNHGYNGPHPFSIIHRYLFKVYALDCDLNISASSTNTELQTAMKGHILGAGVLVGNYKKQEGQPRIRLTGRTNQIRGQEWTALLNQKGTCVSLIISLHNLRQDQITDKSFLQKEIKSLCSHPAKRSPEDDEIISTLRKLQDEVSIHPNDKGIGIYVSSGISFYTGFPFEIREKTIISTGFHLKELLVKEQYSAPYTVLSIDEKEIRLYTGRLNQINEVKNQDYPVFFKDEPEDSFINSFFDRSYNTGFDKKPNEFTGIRHQSILRKTDGLLQFYLQNSTALILCGTRKYLTGFMNATKHMQQVISIIYGNYNRFTEADFSEMVWPIIKTNIEQEMLQEIADYELKLAEGATEEGIAHVWDAIASDRGTALLIEENFAIEGFIAERDTSRLYLHPPQKAHAVLADAVDEIIKIALAKDVKIVFVKDGMLNRHMRIALITKF